MTQSEIQALTSGMFKDKRFYMPELEYDADHPRDDFGNILPYSEMQIATEPVPKSMKPPISEEEILKAEEIATAGDAWLAEIKRTLSALGKDKPKEFMGGGGMLNSKREPRPEEKQNQNIKAAPSEKPGWMMAEGTNFWSVNTDDPYWDTEVGYQEALALYGTSPAWSSRPMEQENNFVDLQPTKRISL